MQTCFIIYMNTYNWKTLNSKSYFTNKPNGHLRYIAYSPIFFVVTVNKLIEVVMETFRISLQISLGVPNNKTISWRRTYLLIISNLVIIFIPVKKYFLYVFQCTCVNWPCGVSFCLICNKAPDHGVLDSSLFIFW